MNIHLTLEQQAGLEHWPSSSQKFMCNLNFSFCNLWTCIMDSTNPELYIVMYGFIEKKKSTSKWGCSVKTHVVQGSSVFQQRYY